jgi:hypothetical protein
MRDSYDVLNPLVAKRPVIQKIKQLIDTTPQPPPAEQAFDSKLVTSQHLSNIPLLVRKTGEDSENYSYDKLPVFLTTTPPPDQSPPLSMNSMHLHLHQQQQQQQTTQANQPNQTQTQTQTKQSNNHDNLLIEVKSTTSAQNVVDPNFVAQRKLRKAETLEYQPSKLSDFLNKAKTTDDVSAKEFVDKTFQVIELLQKELGTDAPRRATVADSKRQTIQK